MHIYKKKYTKKKKLDHKLKDKKYKRYGGLTTTKVGCI